MLKLFRTVYSLFRGTYVNVKKTVNLDHEWYGSKYGGFYVASDSFNENTVVYSFGIGQDISFDNSIINKYNCSVYGFDPTPKSIEWISIQKELSNFHFYPYGIAAQSGEVEFFLPKNSNYVSGSILQNRNVNLRESIKVPMHTLSDITKKLGHSHIDILKMDIEGAEYNVLPSILESGIMVKQILVEFHHRMMRGGAKRTNNAIRLLRHRGYEIFAVSEGAEEVSFIKV